jgi:hypothetical protein
MLRGSKGSKVLGEDGRDRCLRVMKEMFLMVMKNDGRKRCYGWMCERSDGRRKRMKWEGGSQQLKEQLSGAMD